MRTVLFCSGQLQAHVPGQLEVTRCLPERAAPFSLANSQLAERAEILLMDASRVAPLPCSLSTSSFTSVAIPPRASLPCRSGLGCGRTCVWISFSILFVLARALPEVSGYLFYFSIARRSQV